MRRAAASDVRVGRRRLRSRGPQRAGRRRGGRWGGRPEVAAARGARAAVPAAALPPRLARRAHRAHSG